MADYIREEMVKRGAVSWTSPEPALRCGIATVNVPPHKMPDLENWMWKEKRIRIRGGVPTKNRLSPPSYFPPKVVDPYLAAAHEYPSPHPSASLFHPHKSGLPA